MYFLGLFIILSSLFARADDRIPPQVRAFFQDNCYQCHQRNGDGKIGDILDYKNLTSVRGILSPGHPEGSRLVQVLQQNTMPPDHRFKTVHPEGVSTMAADMALQLLSSWVRGLPKEGSLATAALQKVYSESELPNRAVSKAVLQYHGGPSRDGLYVEPSFTRSAIQDLQLTQSFPSDVDGAVDANPVFVDRGITGDKDLLIIATEKNQIAALDASTGAVVWKRLLGHPAEKKALQCGEMNLTGITGTPIVDPGSRSIFLNSMQIVTDKGHSVPRHLVYRLSLATGSTMLGWPVDVAAQLAKSGQDFSAGSQSQIGALSLAHDTVFVPYGAPKGGCGDNLGWVVGIPLDRNQKLMSWQSKGKDGGVRAVGGISSDSEYLFFATGNTDGAPSWAGGKAYIRLPAQDMAFSIRPEQYFSPANWHQAAGGNVDVSGVSPVLVDLPKARHPQIAIGFGANGFIYVVDRQRPGGVGGALMAKRVAQSEITKAPAAYSAISGTYLAVSGSLQNCPAGKGGDFGAVRLTPSPVLQVETAWCASLKNAGSPVVSTIDGHEESIVWAVADGVLQAFNGETGEALRPRSPLPAVSGLGNTMSPIIAQGRIWLVQEGHVSVFGMGNSRGPASRMSP